MIYELFIECYLNKSEYKPKINVNLLIKGQLIIFNFLNTKFKLRENLADKTLKVTLEKARNTDHELAESCIRYLEIIMILLNKRRNHVKFEYGKIYKSKIFFFLKLL